MCGRYRLSKRKQLIEEYFETANKVDWEPRYNIAPSQNVGIIRQDPSRPRREFSQVRWGLIPYWAKEASIGHKMINARSETVADKPAFREAFKNRRHSIVHNGEQRIWCGGQDRTGFNRVAATILPSVPYSGKSK